MPRIFYRFILSVSAIRAQIPPGYYDAAAGLTGEQSEPPLMQSSAIQGNRNPYIDMLGVVVFSVTVQNGNSLVYLPPLSGLYIARAGTGIDTQSIRIVR